MDNETQDITEGQRKDAKTTDIVKFIWILIGLAVFYFMYTLVFSDHKAIHTVQQEKPTINFTDSAEAAIRARLERPNTYEGIAFTNTNQLYGSKYWLKVKFRFKDWKEKYFVSEMTVYMDSTGHVYDFKVNSLN